MKRAFGPALCVLLFVAPLPAAADGMTKMACIEANRHGQDLRRDGKLAGARRAFQACTAPSCPALVRDDCARRLDEVDQAQPTVVFEVRDGQGQDVGGVEVTVDGAEVLTLDGAALPVDPGRHVFVFRGAGGASTSRTLLLTEGERQRRERIVIEAPVHDPSTPVLLPMSQPAAAPPRQDGGTRRVIGLLTTGVGVAGLAVGGVFGALTIQEVARQRSACTSPSDCPSRANALSAHSSASTDGTIATVAFAAGGTLVAAGLALFFTGRPSDTARTSELVVAPGLGGLWLSRRF